MVSDVSKTEQRLTGKTLAIALATLLLLVLPDVVFRAAGYPISSMFSPTAVASLAVIAALLTLTASRRCRMAVITFLVVGQCIWLGYLRYFGAPLSPEQMMLVSSEVQDTASGIGADFTDLLLPVLILSALITTGLCFLHARESRAGILQWPPAGTLLIAFLVLASARGIFSVDPVAAFPSLRSESVLGTYRAAFCAFQLSLVTTKAPPNRTVSSPTVTVTGLPKEPVTVVVIMGESINPSRLSLFGAKRETTPNLTAWASKPPAGFTMIPRVGFSAGVSTRASVPSFIRTSFIPVEGEQRGINLFDLARRQGFKSWVFSAQSDRYESAAGGAVGVERLVAREGNEKTFDRVKDDYLVELVRSVSSKSPYQFFFIHQRVNHIPYLWNCAHLAGAVSRFTHGADVGPKYSEGEQRLASYDDGLRCWDRNVAALVSAFLDRPGAVQIIITADHNELMGEDGLFGHLHPVLRGAAVPFILITNRSDSAVANAFRAMSPRSFYNLSRVVATAFGTDIETPHVSSSFYFNSTLPFGNAGYLEVEQVSPWHFVVASFNRDGSSNRTRSVDLSDVGSAEGFAEKLASPSGS